MSLKAFLRYCIENTKSLFSKVKVTIFDFWPPQTKTVHPLVQLSIGTKQTDGLTAQNIMCWATVWCWRGKNENKYWLSLLIWYLYFLNLTTWLLMSHSDSFIPSCPSPVWDWQAILQGIGHLTSLSFKFERSNYWIQIVTEVHEAAAKFLFYIQKDHTGWSQWQSQRLHSSTPLKN